MTVKATRGKQAKPTRSEIAAYYDLLRSKAQGGDVQAGALLIALAEGRPILPELGPSQGAADLLRQKW